LLDLLFHPLLSDVNQVGAPDFALVDLREVAERQHALQCYVNSIFSHTIAKSGTEISTPFH
jgi:hypothetical protein